METTSAGKMCLGILQKAGELTVSLLLAKFMSYNMCMSFSPATPNGKPEIYARRDPHRCRHQIESSHRAVPIQPAETQGAVLVAPINPGLGCLVIWSKKIAETWNGRRQKKQEINGGS
jgi:hypothetical protein